MSSQIHAPVTLALVPTFMGLDVLQSQSERYEEEKSRTLIENQTPSSP
jgi:hypothetical protein